MIGLIQYFGACASPKIFTLLPTWYSYLPSTTDSNGNCVPSLTQLSDIWLILIAVIEILLRIAALAALVFVIYGGILYTTSQGSPEQTGKAKDTIVNALIGLALAVSAASIIAFLAHSLIK